jgi:signal transduction histidine kinase
VRLDVRDQGGGVPAELGEMAFERFTRADTIDNGVRIELQDAAERVR